MPICNKQAIKQAIKQTKKIKKKKKKRVVCLFAVAVAAADVVAGWSKNNVEEQTMPAQNAIKRSKKKTSVHERSLYGPGVGFFRMFSGSTRFPPPPQQPIARVRGGGGRLPLTVYTLDFILLYFCGHEV